YQSYADSALLSQLVAKFNNENAISIVPTSNNITPVYLLQPPQSNSAMVSIISRLKKTRLRYRGFQSADESRLSATKAIDDIIASHGIVVPLLPDGFKDAKIHNIRAAFVAGLSCALE